MMRIQVTCAALTLLWIMAAPVAVAGIEPPFVISVGTQNERKAKADALLQQGFQHYRDRQFADALQVWKQALTLYQELQDLSAESTTLGAIGAVQLSLGNYRPAIATSQQLLKIAQQTNNQTKQAQALGNLGIAYKNLGNYLQAISYQQQALKLLQASNKRQASGQVLSNLGNTYEALGDYENAIAAYQQSLTIVRELGDRVGESIALGNLGAVHANLGEYNQAVEFYQQSLTIAQATNDIPQQMGVFINLGSAHQSLSKFDQAVEFYQQSIKLGQTIGDRRLTGEALGGLGLVYADLEDYQTSIDYHQKSLAIVQELGEPRSHALALNNLGHAYFKAGKLEQAEQQLRTAIQILDKLRPEDDTYNISVFDTQVLTYNLLQQILIARNQPETALEVAEWGRARAFVALLTRRLAESETEPEREKIDRQAIADNPVLSIQQIRQIARQQNATLVEYSIIPDDAFMFRGKLRGSAAALYIWVVKPTGEVIFRQVDLQSLNTQIVADSTTTTSRSPSRKPELNQLISNTRASIRGNGTNVSSSDNSGNSDTRSKPIEFSINDPSQIQTQLQQLHQFLIAPIADVLPTNPDDRVIFIPQETLFLVPFAALQDAENKYLIEKHTILIAPSIQVLSFTQSLQAQQKITEGSPLIVGNPTMPKIALAADQPLEQLSPLPGAEEEATAIAKLFNTQALIGAEGTKAIVLQKIRQAPLVHLATHGLLEYSSPDSQSSLQGLGIPGAIALAPSQKDDGLLTANEILNLRLGAELVVLSACDTGQGRITGDGVIGLSRALISAGVPSVVVSLWAVPDSPTAQLMIAFYQNLQQQPDKARALRQAMLTTMKDYPDPIDWAAFTLIGEAE